MAVTTLNIILVVCTGAAGAFIIVLKVTYVKDKKNGEEAYYVPHEKIFEYFIGDPQNFKYEILDTYLICLLYSPLLFYRSVASIVLSVWMHMCAASLPIFPVFIATSLYGQGIAYLDKERTEIVTVGQIATLVYLALSFVQLLMIYLKDQLKKWQVAYAAAAWFFFTIRVGVITLAFLYLAHVIYWLVLGALVKPDDVLPFTTGTMLVL